MQKILISIAIMVGLVALQEEARAQAKPDVAICKQRGGLRDCREPDVGKFVYTFQRCDEEHPALDEVDATQRGAARYYSGCGGDWQIVQDGPWFTPASQGNGICGGGYALYPKMFLGYETQNQKGVNVRYCNGPNPSFDGFIVWRRQSVTCPDGFGPDNTEGSPNFGLCVSVFPTKCLICGDNEDKAGNPLNVFTFNKIETATDLRLSGSHLAFTRTYNAQADLHTGVIGRKWRHSLERSLEIQYYALSGAITAIREDGHRLGFWTSATQLISDPDVIDKVTANRDAMGAIIGWTYLVGADNSIEQYNVFGQLVSHTLRTGVGIALEYSNATTPVAIAPVAGLLVVASDTFGRTIGFTYDAQGRITKMVAPDGSEYLYAYTADPGDLISVTFPDKKTRTYVYNETAYISNNASLPGVLTGIIDENGQRFANFGYNYNRAAVMTEHAGGVDRYTLGNYDGGGGATIVSGPLGSSKTLYRQSIQGIAKLLEHDEPCPTCTNGTLIRYAPSYDANGNRGVTQRPNGNYTSYSYDLTRNLEISRVEGIYGGSIARTIVTTWHPTYRLPASITEPVSTGSKLTLFTYDAAGNATGKSVTVNGNMRSWSWTYDSLGRVLTATDSRNITTTNTYFPNDASQGYNRGMLASVTNAVGHTTSLTSYNAHGLPLSMIDANGLVTNMGYDAMQRLNSRTVGSETTTYAYDGVGQLTFVSLPDGSSLTYSYDAAHRLYRITDGANNRVLYTLDDMGNRIKEDYVDPLGSLARTRSRVYDALGRLAQETGGANQTTGYRYDLNGNQGELTDPLNRVTSQPLDAYDGLDRMVKSVDTAGGLTKYEYDAQDNLTKVTDPKNLATTYVYSGFNELTSQASPDTGSTSFSYDNAGNMLTKTDARGVTSTYTYDVLNRVNTISYPAYGGDAAETVTYTYDSCSNGKGRLCTLTDKTGTTSYSYNLLGRVTAKSQAVAALTQTIVYGYNSAGQLTSVTYPSGALIGYGYLNNRITSVTINGTTVLSNADYEPFGPIGEWRWGNSTAQAVNNHVRYFDLDGRNTRIESVVGLDPSIIVYDAASRITDLQKVTGSAVDPTKSSTYGYDNLDRLTTVTPNAGNSNSSRGFSYDGLGNRLSATVAGNVTNYGYGTGSHRLNNLTGATGINYTYDAAGNRASSAASTWTYGGNNRPAQVTVGATTTTFLINALGQRVRKATSGVGTRFVYDEAGRLIGEYNDSGTRINETVWFNDLPVAVMK